MTVQEQLRALVHKHHGNFIEQIACVGRLLADRNGEGLAPSTSIVEAQGITHQMKGTAGSMGFADLSSAAAELDASLKQLKAVDGPVSAAQMEAAVERLTTLQSISAQTTPEMSTLYNADLSRLMK